jgi:hypothetical protein
VNTFWAIAAFCGAFLAIVGFITVVRSAVRWLQERHQQSRKGLYKALGRLTPNVQLEHFNAVLGMSPTTSSGNEHLYVHTRFYVQAVTNDSGVVLMYAVTTRQREFNPPLWGGLLRLHEQAASLGKNPYADIIWTGLHTGAMAWLSPQTFYYMESTSSGAIGHLTLVIGYNDAGVHFEPINSAGDDKTGPSDVFPQAFCWGPDFVQLGDMDGPHAENDRSMQSPRFVEGYFGTEEVRKWRRRNMPNTYAVAGPLQRPTVASQIGPERREVWLLPE